MTRAKCVFSPSPPFSPSQTSRHSSGQSRMTNLAKHIGVRNTYNTALRQPMQGQTPLALRRSALGDSSALGGGSPQPPREEVPRAPDRDFLRGRRSRPTAQKTDMAL